MIKSVRRIAIITLVLNIFLTIMKLSFGFLGSSESLVSDGFNSLVDVLVSILLIFVLKLSNKKPDKDHPYGHEKYEGVMYLFLSFLILLTGLVLITTGSISLIKYFNNTKIIKTPELYTSFVAIFALIIKLFLFIINHYFGIKYESSSLKGDSKNHLVDILATFVSLLAIIFARFGFLYFEAIGTIVISIFVLYTGIKMIKEAISFLVDEAPKKEVVKMIRDLILKQEGVIKIDDLKVRKHMNHLYVDVEIAVLNNLTLEKAHSIAEKVHDVVELKFNALHCMVHVNPYIK